MIRILEDITGIVLFPSMPAVINGKPYWSWLEFNPETHQAITRLHTGEHGAMVERLFSNGGRIRSKLKKKLVLIERLGNSITICNHEYLYVILFM